MRTEPTNTSPERPTAGDPPEPASASARLAAIRASILRGTYVVDLDRLAERIVEDELARRNQ